MKTLYHHGNIITVNETQPSADALLVKDGKIAAVGSYDTLKKEADESTTLVDLNGHTMLPGFIDGHGHIGNPMVALPKAYPPPNGTIDSKENFLKELKRLYDEHVLLKSGWLVIQGYDNAFFEKEAHPLRSDLDAVVPNLPVLALHASGHVAVVNSKALETVGWTKDSPNPEGGVLRHDPFTGELNGLIEEKAIHIVGLGYALAGYTIEEQADFFVESQKFYASYGITTAQEGGSIRDTIHMLEYCQKNNKLIIDLVAYPVMEYIGDMIPDDSSKQTYRNHFKIGGAKVIADGSPQGKTAWLTKPYYKKPDGREDGYLGYPIYSDEQMDHFCGEALKHNWQLLVHCNGDAVGDQLLRSYQKAKQDSGNNRDLRPVMIHAQTVREDQLDLMKQLGMMPSFFHDHVFYWGDFHLDSVLGPERGKRISPLQSAVKRNMPFTLHNDTPVTPPNTIFEIHNAVNRTTRAGREIGKEYAVDVMEAIRAVTIYGAYQYFDEAIKGSLEVGKLADLVILDQNPLTVDPKLIKNIQVLETVKEGQTIYKKSSDH